MVGRLVMVATLASGLLVTGVAWGQSKCDKGINKASAKKVGDCVVQTGSCGNKEVECDNAAASLCAGSPSGAFLDADLSRF